MLGFLGHLVVGIHSSMDEDMDTGYKDNEHLAHQL